MALRLLRVMCQNYDMKIKNNNYSQKYPELKSFAECCFNQIWDDLNICPFEVVRYAVHLGERASFISIVKEFEYILTETKSDIELEKIISGLRFDFRLSFFEVSPMAFIENLLDFIKYVAYLERELFLGKYKRDWGAPVFSGKRKCDQHCAEFPCVVRLFDECFSSDLMGTYYLGYVDKSRDYVSSLSEKEYDGVRYELDLLHKLKLDSKMKKDLLHEKLGLGYSLDYYAISSNVFLKELLLFL